VGGDALAKVTRTVHRWFEDTGAFTGFAIALFVVGTLFVLAEAQSPSLLQWTGTAVHNVQSGGIAYYSFHGQNYTLNVDSPDKWSSTIYLDPADPSNAMFANTVHRGHHHRRSIRRIGDSAGSRLCPQVASSATQGRQRQLGPLSLSWVRTWR